MHELTVCIVAEKNVRQRRKCSERRTIPWNDRNRDKTVRETEFHVCIPSGKEFTKFGTLAGVGGIGMLVGAPAGWIQVLPCVYGPPAGWIQPMACFCVHHQAGYRHWHACGCTCRLDTGIDVTLCAPAGWIQPLTCFYVHQKALYSYYMCTSRPDT